MNLSRRSLLVALLAFAAAGALMAACGGDDDSDTADNDASTSSGSKETPKSSGSRNKIPDIKDGAFRTGAVSIAVSGGKDLKIEGKGTGITSGGFTLLTYTGSGVTIQIAFQKDSPDEPGALIISGESFAAGGEWGKECTISLDDGANELKGEFSCKDADALIDRAKDAKVNIKGTFTATR